MSIVGTAGWAIPARYREGVPAAGSQLQRYAAHLNGVEINSSFYRTHRRGTYERWARSVPDGFRFSVKVPRTLTRDHRLAGYGALLDMFLEEIAGLGEKLGVLLAQLPPSLPFDPGIAEAFFADLGRAPAALACEPRHPSWFAPEADALLRSLGVARVAADPPRAPSDGAPGGDTVFAYWRLHGSPKIYYSDYLPPALKTLAQRLRPNDWCIFDNTMGGHALGNALETQRLAAP